MTWDTINTLSDDEEREHWRGICNLIYDKAECITADYDYGQVCMMLRHAPNYLAQRGAEILYDIICRNGYDEDVYYYPYQYAQNPEEHRRKGRLSTAVTYNRPAIVFTPYTKQGKLSKRNTSEYYADTEAQALEWLTRKIRPVEAE